MDQQGCPSGLVFWDRQGGQSQDDTKARNPRGQMNPDSGSLSVDMGQDRVMEMDRTAAFLGYSCSPIDLSDKTGFFFQGTS